MLFYCLDYDVFIFLALRDREATKDPHSKYWAVLHLNLKLQKAGEVMNTVQLHRVICAPLARVFQAFVDPEALVKWLAPHGFTARVKSLDLRVGGGYQMSFRNFSTGTVITFSGHYQEIIPNQRLCYSDQFDDPNLAGNIQVTIDFKAVPMGTELFIMQTGIPEQIPLDGCYVGWQQSLQLLELLVTPEISDQ